MDVAQQIEEIETALKKAGVPLTLLLREAKLDRSTWTRWRAGSNGPRLTNWVAAKTAAQSLLVKHEAA